MAYVKTIWKEQIVQNPDTYNVIDNVDGTKTITPSFGNVIQEGTPISPENLQKIEEELEKLSEGGGTGGGHKILDKNGLELPQQPNLQFIGTGVTKIINDEIKKATVVEIAGEKGDDGLGIKSTISTYQISSNGTTIPTGAWLDNIQTLEKGKFLWVKLVQVLADDSLLPAYYFSIYQGQDGVKGDSGNDGIGVQSISSTYQVSTSGTVIPTGTWEDSIPAVPQGQYLWSKTIQTLTDNSTLEPHYTVSYQGLDGLGSGDMTKVVYDKNNNGIVDSAEKLETARTISLSSDVTGSASFDGSSNVSIVATLSNTGVTAGQYSLLNVDAKGRVTSASKPSLISGLGITDVYTKTQVDTFITDITTSDNIIAVVQTYALLQAYNTTKVKDNDIISVAEDETHNGAKSFYKWTGSPKAWVYQFSETLKATQTYVDSTFLTKPVEVSKTLLASGWVGSAAPYTYTLTGITEIKTSKTLGQLVYTKQGATTDSNYLLWKKAIESADIQFVNELQDVGKLVLKAWGTKPTIDLPILLLIGGEEQ